MLNFLIAWLHSCIIIYGWWNPNIWSNLQRCNSEPSRGGKFPQFLTWSSDFTVSTVNLKSKLKKMCTGYFVVLIIFSKPVVIGEFSPAGAAEVAEAACARYARTEGGLWKWRLQDSGLGMKMWKHIFIAQHYTRTCYLFLSLHCIAEQQLVHLWCRREKNCLPSSIRSSSPGSSVRVARARLMRPTPSTRWSLDSQRLLASKAKIPVCSLCWFSVKLFVLWIIICDNWFRDCCWYWGWASAQPTPPPCHSSYFMTKWNISKSELKYSTDLPAWVLVVMIRWLLNRKHWRMASLLTEENNQDCQDDCHDPHDQHCPHLKPLMAKNRETTPSSSTGFVWQNLPFIIHYNHHHPHKSTSHWLSDSMNPVEPE